MRIGIGVPAAVPGTDMTTLGQWAADSERAGFDALGVIDRLVYDNVEPLTALAAAASRTSRVELITTVLNVGWRNNPVLLAKQLASVEQISGGRLTAGLGLGGWPADYTASHAPQHGKAALWEATLAAFEQVWSGEPAGMSKLPAGRPALLFGGLVPAAYTRAATRGEGWVAPLMGLPALRDGAAAVRKAWVGRPGRPRIVTGRYFSLGPDADAIADEYLRHYYGDAYFPMARADTITTADQLHATLSTLEEAGATDVVLYPAAAGLEQIDLLSQALELRR
jgi:alkanesulfonate monooxygenase SsuD/methylene tetrahydromethanopterin reductase-like flavin-dependent oxidoreductase (luciferase family)